MDLFSAQLVQLVVVTLCCDVGQLVKTTIIIPDLNRHESILCFLGYGTDTRARTEAANPWWYEEALSGLETGRTKGNVLSFRYTFVEGDGYFGAPVGDGSWNGMIGMLKRQEIDIALGPFAMSHERRQVVDFTVPLLMEKMKIMVLRPEPQPNPWGLVAPFSWYVWFGVASTFFVVAFVSFCIVRCLKSGGPAEAKDHLWSAFAILVTQALAWQPNGFTLRFLFCVWMLCCIVIVNSYSGSLTSLLAVTTVSASHDSLQDVVKDKDLKLIMEANTAFTTHLKMVKGGIYKELSEAATKRGIFEPADSLWLKSRQLLRDGRHALLAEELTLLKFMADDMSHTGRCDFYMSSGEFWPVIVSMAVVQGSPLLDHINARVLMLREYGIYNAWIGRELDNVTQCVTPESRLPLLPYTLTDLWLAFLFLGGGLVAASVALACELWWHKGRQRRQARRVVGLKAARSSGVATQRFYIEVSLLCMDAVLYCHR
ncbi:probable glutamate receptor [Penaeus indicus]|uniref:probable glutamate receptor n=1 Tax=Penaeus indicus TaxID=29960 RepID=UPI00300C00F9